MRRAAGALALTATALAVVAACSPGRPGSGHAVPGPRPVIVASFNFPESELLAEIYAEALEHAGVPVDREFDLGPRELVLPAVRQGLVDVVPEYQGSLLAALDPTAHLQGATTEDERGRLAGALSAWHFELLPAAPAQNQNGLAVTRVLAGRLGLRAVSDLARVAPTLKLGAPSECPTRPFCVPGFESVYGLHFAAFVPFDAESQRVSALQQQVVDVAVMFTTDGVLATGDYVLLADDRHLQPADNVAPIVSARTVADYGQRAVDALDAVSAKLTEQALVFLNWRVSVAGKAVASEARGWLQRQHLVPGA